MKYSSNLINEAVEVLAELPSIGRKSALRLVLHLLRDQNDLTARIAEKLVKMKSGIKKCKECMNYSDQDICAICSDESRNKELLCVVESIRDVIAIEETNQYNGLYHVLGGVISPIEGIGPEEIYIEELMHRMQSGQVKEIIMAISPTIDGETTIFYMAKKLQEYQVRISTIARGVSFGGELEYADELTLGRSILSRTPYESTLKT